jgi:GNAT superfamily N-acetyltransferase
MNLHKKMLEFIHTHGNRRITQAAFDFYKDINNGFFGTFENDGDGKEAKMIGLSLSGLHGNDVIHSITVVHTDFRNKGIGTKLLQEKIDMISQFGYNYSTVVAEDNQPSLRICQKSSLKEVERVKMTRKGGEFKAVKFSD